MALMKPVLPFVRAWYPSDEPDTKIPVETLQKIVDVLKRDTPAVDVLLTLSSLALDQHPGRQTFNLSDVPANADIVAFGMHCYPGAKPAGGGRAACSVRWPNVESRLERLAAFAAQHAHMRVAVIPDATAATTEGIGALSQRELNNRYLAWCSRQLRCVAMLPFVGGHWADAKQEGAAYAELERIGDAVRTRDWSNTSLGAALRLHCPTAGVLTHVPCADHNCDDALY